MAKKKWFSEQELSDLFWETVKRSDGLFDGDLYGSIFREMQIAHKLRPDYIVYSQELNQHVYHILEMKIHADLEAVAQLANYLWVCATHVRNAKQGTYAAGSSFDFRGHLLARTFDRGVYSLASVAGIRLWRIKPEERGDGISLLIEEEGHPFEDVNLDSQLIALFQSGDPINYEGELGFDVMTIVQKGERNG